MTLWRILKMLVFCRIWDAMALRRKVIRLTLHLPLRSLINSVRCIPSFNKAMTRKNNHTASKSSQQLAVRNQLGLGSNLPSLTTKLIDWVVFQQVYPTLAKQKLKVVQSLKLLNPCWQWTLKLVSRTLNPNKRSIHVPKSHLNHKLPPVP